jgi:hypothetical protein
MWQVEQSSGSALFVPSEWLHTVANLRPCLSVNANWCNAHNLAFCFRRLRRGHASKKARNDVAAALLALALARKAAAPHGGRSGSSGSGECSEGGGLLTPVGAAPAAGSDALLATGAAPLAEGREPSVAEAPAVEPAVSLGGKAPFDLEDLLKLLAWKARTMLEHHAQAQLQSDDDDEFKRSSDVAAVAAVAGAISEDPCFAVALQREAAKILIDLSSAKNSFLSLINTASKVGPHTKTDRGTCPVVGL